MPKTTTVSGTFKVYNAGDVADVDTDRLLSWTNSLSVSMQRQTFDALNPADGAIAVAFGDMTTIYAIYLKFTAEVDIALTPTAGVLQTIQARFLVLGDDDLGGILGEGYIAPMTILATQLNTDGEVVIVGV